MKTNMTYGPALDYLDSSVQQACRTDIEGLILSVKQYRRGIIFTSKFAKLAIIPFRKTGDRDFLSSTSTRHRYST
jgi:hypothetical protein